MEAVTELEANFQKYKDQRNSFIVSRRKSELQQQALKEKIAKLERQLEQAPKVFTQESNDGFSLAKNPTLGKRWSTNSSVAATGAPQESRRRLTGSEIAASAPHRR